MESEFNFMNLALKRFSCRKYVKNKKIEKDLIIKCVEAARIAPSASNSQPWKYIIIDDDEIKDKVVNFLRIGSTKFNQFAKDSSAIIVVVEEPKNMELKLGQIILGRKFADFDIGCSVTHFCLQATELGLATCIMGIFDEKYIKKLLKIPFNRKIVIIISLGYSDEIQKEKKRKELAKICSFNTFN